MIELPDDDVMLKIWVSLLVVSMILNFIMTSYSYCNLDIPLCQTPVPVSSTRSSIPYTLGKTIHTKGRSLSHLKLPLSCSKIPLVDLDKPMTKANTFGIIIIIIVVIYLLYVILSTYRFGYTFSINQPLFGVLAILGILFISNVVGRQTARGNVAGGPFSIITALIGMGIIGVTLRNIASNTSENIYRYLALGTMAVMVIVFGLNVKNIYAGFIQSATTNVTTTVLVLAQLIALSDLIRMTVTTDDNLFMSYAIVLAIAYVAHLAYHLYKIIKCYQFSYKCVPEGSYVKEKGQLFATIGCHAEF